MRKPLIAATGLLVLIALWWFHENPPSSRGPVAAAGGGPAGASAKAAPPGSSAGPVVSSGATRVVAASGAGPAATGNPLPAAAAAGTADETKLGASARRQISLLEEDKARRSPVQNKIDSQLLYAEKQRRNEPAAQGVVLQPIDLDRDASGRVLVDIKAAVSDDLLGEIRKLGGHVLSSFARYRAIRAAVPLAEVEHLAARADVVFVEPAARALANVGSVDSEGDTAHRADTARTSFGVTGAGTKVAVLSDSVDHLANSQALGDLGAVTVLPGQTGTGEGEGTAMLEIVHDLAPGAQLFFATAFAGPASFANNIRQLRAAGCDIIIDDVEYYSESPFQDGPIAQAVNDVTAAGALFFSSASNAGNKTYNTSGTWEGDFADGGPITTAKGSGRFHSFGTANFNRALPGGDHLRVDLFWADPLGQSANDYDFYVLDPSGSNVVASANSTQNGTQDPYESVNKLENGQIIVVVQASGAGRFLHLSTGRGRLSINTIGNSKGHSAAVDAYSVAAVSAFRTTTPFTAANKVEANFSDGPRRVFFNVDGSPITPGNFSSTGGTVRQKPDIAAADGVKTTLPPDSGLNPFFGTSAAAPHAGAIAALVKSYNPALTPAQMRALLTSATLDIEAAGVDINSGHGLLMADLALQGATAAQPPTITTLSPATGGVGTAVTIVGTKFTGATGVKFNGTAATFTVVSAAQINVVVPAGATTGPVTVTTAGGTATSPGAFAVTAVPVIADFTPASGNAGAVVTITGANLDGTSAVGFGGTAAGTFTVVSPTQLTATVPAGATTGKIVVTTPNGTAQSAGVFTITTTPVISGFSPLSGAIGGIVVVSGANLTGASAVTFNNVAATAFTVNSSAQITATVPAGASTGLIRVTTPSGTAASGVVFLVVPPPTISGLDPASGAAGASVAINGANLAGATAVTFNGAGAAAFSVVSATRILATAPAGVATGPVRVTTAGGTAVGPAFTALPAPDNDFFAAAQIISGTAGTVSGSNVAATKEPGEPNHAGNRGGKSIWYRWVAPAAGTWTLDTVGSGFDTVLAVYTGGPVGNLAPIAANDDIMPGVTNSRVAFVAAAGTTYFIAVDGFAQGLENAAPAASGPVTLNWAATAAVPAIASFSPTSGAVGAAVVITGANFTGVTNVAFNGAAAAFTVDSAGQITAMVPAGATTGPITVNGPGGTAGSAAPFTLLNTGNNDDFANALALSGAAGTVSGSSATATKQTGEPAHAGNPGGRSIWFAWTAPGSGQWIFNTAGSGFDTLLGVYTGTAVEALATVASNDDANSVRTSQVAFDAVAGTTYRIAVDGFGGAGGDVVLNWVFAPDAPSISGFTPPSGGIGSSVVISGANFKGVLGVRFNGVSTAFYTVDSATRITATVPIVASTGPISITTSNGTAQSATAFVVTGGQSSNDDFARRIAINGATATVTGSSVGATKEAGEPNHAGNAGGRSVWWTWTAPTSGAFTVSTRGSDFDTLLGVYAGSGVATLTTVASNDDGPGAGTASSVSFTATGGQTYQIAVDGFNGAAGNVVLSVYPAVLPQDVFFTGFEATEGYNPAFTLAGQAGWGASGSGQNGVVQNNFGDGTQQGYVGFSSPVNGGSMVLGRALNFAPDLNTRPLVRFSVDMRIIDSTNFRYDDFGWIVHNQSGAQLFYLDFSNANLGIYSQLNSGPSYTDSGRTFVDGQIYHLEIAMDFSRNQWGATIGGVSVVSGLPISAAGGVPLNLGDISAVWLRSSGAVGDNYLAFDNYRVTAEAGQAPRIVTAPQDQSVTVGAGATLRVVADSALSLTYQWRRNGADIPGATAPVLQLNGLTAGEGGSYQVVVSNAAGTVTTAAAMLTVSQPANLTPFKPNGWSDKITASVVPDSNLDAGILYDHQDIYVGWAVINVAGGPTISTPFYTQLYVDGALSFTWRSQDLMPDFFTLVTNYDIGKLSVGMHTLRIDTDTTGVVPESNEGDNSYTKTIVVGSTNNLPPRLGLPVRAPNGGFQFTLGGVPLRTFEIQASTNLVDWTVLQTVVNTNGDGQLPVFDPAAATFNQRFYRGRILPATP